MENKGLSLKQQILLAALECSGSDCRKNFTMEDLIVSAWKKDRLAWGMRGYEKDYPDSDKIQKEIGTRGEGQKGMVDLGLFERVDRRVYRLTPAGLASASKLKPTDVVAGEKADRTLETAVKEIIDHPVFNIWIKDPTRPKYFRQAGHFWGIAPGTPPKTVRDRVNRIDQTLKATLDLLDHRDVDEIIEQRGKVLFDRKDIERCIEFHKELKKRFAKDLRLLDPSIKV